jgi:hypothetical protein
MPLGELCATLRSTPIPFLFVRLAPNELVACNYYSVRAFMNVTTRTCPAIGPYYEEFCLLSRTMLTIELRWPCSVNYILSRNLRLMRAGGEKMLDFTSALCKLKVAFLTCNDII